TPWTTSPASSGIAWCRRPAPQRQDATRSIPRLELAAPSVGRERRGVDLVDGVEAVARVADLVRPLGYPDIARKHAVFDDERHLTRRSAPHRANPDISLTGASRFRTVALGHQRHVREQVERKGNAALCR